MLRPATAVLAPARQLAFLSRPATLSSARLFSTTISTRAEGDTGGTRSGGSAQADAFSKREKANEDKFVREQEMKKLHALREKLARQEQDISSLKSEVEGIIEENEANGKK